MTVVSKEPTDFDATVLSLIDLFITGEPGLVRTFLQLALPDMNTDHGLLYRYCHVYDKTEDEPTPNVRHYTLKKKCNMHTYYSAMCTDTHSISHYFNMNS
jgi:hypothetical protein